jgi:DNA-binding MarR family transcriptional regulator
MDEACADRRLDLRLWLRLFACSSLIEQRVRRGLREVFATTLPRFDLMAQLDRAPEGLTMSELSRRLMVSNGNVTGLIDRLVAEELVDRRASEADRRAQLVRLTPAGMRSFAAMTPAHEAWIADVFKTLAPADKRLLLALLARLKTALTEQEDPP